MTDRRLKRKELKTLVAGQRPKVKSEFFLAKTTKTSTIEDKVHSMFSIEYNKYIILNLIDQMETEANISHEVLGKIFGNLLSNLILV